MQYPSPLDPQQIEFLKTFLISIGPSSFSIRIDKKEMGKELSLCHKLGFLNLNFFKTKCRRP